MGIEQDPIGFAVLYVWKLLPSKEEQFQVGWRHLTESLRDHCGAIGSRLHHAEDGTWVAYNAWPDKATWERARATPPPDTEAVTMMRDAIEQEFPPLLMECVTDLCG